MHPVILQAYANAVAADRRSRRRPQPVIRAAVRGGDCVVIPPGAVHKLFNPGTEPLVLLCSCAPAYSHEDTVLTGG